jgi:hypothetical protein
LQAGHGQEGGKGQAAVERPIDNAERLGQKHRKYQDQDHKYRDTDNLSRNVTAEAFQNG